MSADKTPIHSMEELRDEILPEILTNWPLYRTLRYTVPNNEKPQRFFPQEISMYCSDTMCDHVQRWTWHGTYEASSYVDSIIYACRNCEQKKWYFYRWILPTIMLKNDGSILPSRPGAFQKIGQFPPLEERISRTLEEQLNKGDGQDLDLYRKALRSYNHNYGIGALAYLRRVVENRMNSLLDLIQEAAHESELTPEQIQQIDEIKKSRVFDDKVKFAANLLPSHLRPDGHNPIDDLHDLTSEGLHRRSDDECLDIFDQSRHSFEYLFSRLEIEKTSAQEFVKGHRELVKRKQQTPPATAK